MNLKIEKVELYDDYEGLKNYFKISLKKYKDAQEILKLEGFVTEYVEIQKQKIGLYKNTYSYEKDEGRVQAIEGRIEEMVLSIRK